MHNESQTIKSLSDFKIYIPVLTVNAVAIKKIVLRFVSAKLTEFNILISCLHISFRILFTTFDKHVSFFSWEIVRIFLLFKFYLCLIYYLISVWLGTERHSIGVKFYWSFERERDYNFENQFYINILRDFIVGSRNLFFDTKKYMHIVHVYVDNFLKKLYETLI